MIFYLLLIYTNNSPHLMTFNYKYIPIITTITDHTLCTGNRDELPSLASNCVDGRNQMAQPSAVPAVAGATKL